MKGRHNMMRVGTVLTDTGVLQTRDICGEVTHHFAAVCAKQMDEKLRERLLELGWMPPEEAQKLRNLRWTQGEAGEE